MSGRTQDSPTTMALAVTPTNGGKRVKVYELRENDWFDRGTGFCTGQVINDEPKIYVESEDEPDRMLLETSISREDGFLKQQATLIVWNESHRTQPRETEPPTRTDVNRTDMALSFQEADGCTAIWDFVSQVQQHLLALAEAGTSGPTTPPPDDALSDDAMEAFPIPVMLPAPDLSNLAEIDHMVRTASTSPQGRDSLSKFLIGEDYIQKLVPLVGMAEDLERVAELHRLSNIMKMLILLNDTQIIEYMVSDGVVMGVIGALEYDQEFPNHRANHRGYLRNRSRFKEVVPIDDPNVEKKIHATWRLQYLKDVVLARMLDDPTFGVLNSLIFFNQVEIVSHLQSDTAFVAELFSVIDDPGTSTARRKDAVCFIQQCCAIAKNLQAPARGTLYSNFVQNGLVNVITFALGSRDQGTRGAGSDILIAMIDHDPGMVRAHIFKAMNDKRTPLTETLINVLLVEDDLAVKGQAADAIRILLDPAINAVAGEATGRTNEQFLSKFRVNPVTNSQTESFIQYFYDNGARRLFKPLKDLEKRGPLDDFSLHEAALMQHLVEVLTFFVRQHMFRSRYFLAGEAISARVGQLLLCSQKHVRLAALKYFRTCLGLQDEFYFQQVAQNHIFSPLIDIVLENRCRDSLLASACLELFDFVRREDIKPVIVHIVENYRHRLQDITFVDLFANLILRYDQMQSYNEEMENNLFAQGDDGAPLRAKVNGNTRWAQAVKEMDAVEEEYFNTSDDEEELATRSKPLPSQRNGGAWPTMKPLVDYPDDDDDDDDDDGGDGGDDDDNENENSDGGSPPVEALARSFHGILPRTADETRARSSSSQRRLPTPQAPPERLSEKRRREEDEEDELGKLSYTKRRSSSASLERAVAGNGAGEQVKAGSMLRRKKSLSNIRDSPKGTKIAISLAMKSPIPAERRHGAGG